eukprot:TRINITY_DN25252_c0_g1_i1.p1 TRINITY_DN25252_c0_g1~~TRINITY_DN25252_c0_g1_i1.p1  ORF type:complete len:556 (-),score=108.40 TRINITY_DN25252_c0_g1_i1:300-1967(-)
MPSILSRSLWNPPGLFNSNCHFRKWHIQEKTPLTISDRFFLKLYRPKKLLVLATLSSFANDGDCVKKGKDEAKNNGGMQGMALALNVNERTAYGITIGIGASALMLPVFMQPVITANAVRFKAIAYVTMLCGFYMAWNIGANDVANAMGTSVGSGALTLRQAVLTAAILEFSGALLMGSHVSHTMQKGILVPGIFHGRDRLMFSGMLSALAAAGTWLQVASYYGLPVSTTHCIIGAMVGFGLVYGGVGAVYWGSLARVVSSWIVSPVVGAAVSYVVYFCIRRFVYSAASPGHAAANAAPVAVFVGVSALTWACFPTNSSKLVTVSLASTGGLMSALAVYVIIQRQLGDLLGAYCEISTTKEEQPAFKLLAKVGGPSGTELRIVYTIFGYIQVLSACFMSFAHGTNDVANAIGPLASALQILQGVGFGLGNEKNLSFEILLWGGFGIVAGLMIWGYRVIATIGRKITELTPTRGFAAEFAAASVVTMASRLGLPISATHTLVGAVMGVGFARGLKSVSAETMKEIVASWAVTIPVGALLSVIYTFILSRVLSPLWY